jgi:hypothetical protein
MIPPFLKDKLSERDGEVHIVYEGTLASLDGDHYDLRKIFKDIASHGMHIHVYDSHSNEDYKARALRMIPLKNRVNDVFGYHS